MADGNIFAPKYGESRALVIGINDYKFANPLNFAMNDAEKFSECLSSNFGFDPGKIEILTDKSATRKSILKHFLAFTDGNAGPDDRIVFFFAGHGHTKTGRRGEIGFLVPYDGKIDSLDSLIRWDDLTRNAELIEAKHILFIMDACYGGLAVTRRLQPGSTRFAKDMLLRYSRQALTAGKANETVADAGGPRSGHSIFTGHLLDALDGGAASSDELITANGVMAYVYDKVANDYQSMQTPHYGHLDGDGDFVFNLEALKILDTDSPTDQDLLVQVPSTLARPNGLVTDEELTSRVKELISDGRNRIALHDLVSAEIRAALSKLSPDDFPLSGQEHEPSAERFAERLTKYEDSVRRLTIIVILLARWGTADQRPVLEHILARLGEINDVGGGYVSWLGLRWYPVLTLIYAAGIASLSGRNYEIFKTLFQTKIVNSRSGSGTSSVVICAVDGMANSQVDSLFKTIPGHERQYIPKSEYLLKKLQPSLDDALFIGLGYEDLFDEFESLFALIIADKNYDEEHQRIWAPPGRFAYKWQRGHEDPLGSLIEQASIEKDQWPPIAIGFFDGAYTKFSKIADGYKNGLTGLHWY